MTAERPMLLPDMAKPPGFHIVQHIVASSFESSYLASKRYFFFDLHLGLRSVDAILENRTTLRDILIP